MCVCQFCVWECKLVRESVREYHGCHGFVYKQDSSLCWMTSVVALRLVDECCNSTHTHTHTVSDISLKASYEITAERMGRFVIWNSLRSLSVLHLSVSPSNLTLPRSDERRPWCLYVSALEALWRVFEVSTGKSVSLRWFLMFICRDFVAVTKLPLLDFGGKAQIWLCCIF